MSQPNSTHRHGIPMDDHSSRISFSSRLLIFWTRLRISFSSIDVPPVNEYQRTAMWSTCSGSLYDVETKRICIQPFHQVPSHTMYTNELFSLHVKDLHINISVKELVLKMIMPCRICILHEHVVLQMLQTPQMTLWVPQIYLRKGDETFITNN